MWFYSRAETVRVLAYVDSGRTVKNINPVKTGEFAAAHTREQTWWLDFNDDGKKLDENFLEWFL